MLERRALVATIALILLLLPRTVVGGEVFIGEPNCWCEVNTVPQEWYLIPVNHLASTPADCDIVSAAFRIVGVPDDPAFMRGFDPAIPGGITGDPFGEGAIVHSLVGLPGNLILGFIRLYIATPLAPQVWSIEAHLGQPGTLTPVAEFESNPGVWVAQTGRSTRVDSEDPQCEACAPLPAIYCPQAVEPGTWSTVKRLYE